MAVKPSDLTSKIDIPAGISPINDVSEFPTHYSDFGFGGMRTVSTTAERDNIPSLRRVDGMIVYVENDETYYRLDGGITNTDWVEFSSGSAGNQVGLTEIDFAVADWTETNAPTGGIVVDIKHDLGERNITVDWFETNNDGNAFVPWETIDANNIRGCIPKGSFDSSATPVDTGNAFGGMVRITAFVQPANTSNIEGARFTFNSMTSGTGASWEETGTDTGIFELEINHGLSTNAIEYDYYIDEEVPNLIRATTISTTQLTIQVPEASVFAGSVFITKVT